jgi:ATPase subunit of ABC transporter with duplicated ATPase domains
VVGIVGENGVGKTTLLKIICGEIKPDSGHVDFGGERIGYVPQFFEFTTNTSVEEFLYAVNPDIKEYEIKKALYTVALDHLKRNTPINFLSGGEKTRLYFASLLLAKFPPTFLILDEPTNNLDVEGIEWLEDFLTAFDGGVLLASHDRAFLDTVSSQIIEMHDGGVTLYGGNYSFYREQKEIEEEAYQKRYVAQQKNIRHIEENVKKMKERAQLGEVQFSSRMPYQRAKIRKSAAQAVYRQKRLEKFLMRCPTNNTSQ